MVAGLNLLKDIYPPYYMAINHNRRPQGHFLNVKGLTPVHATKKNLPLFWAEFFTQRDAHVINYLKCYLKSHSLVFCRLPVLIKYPPSVSFVGRAIFF